MRVFYLAAIRLGKADAANRHVIHVCNALARQGYHIWLFVPVGHQAGDTLHASIKVVDVPAFNRLGDFLRSLSYYLMTPLVAGWYMSRNKPSLVYSRGTYLDWIALLPLKLFWRVFFVPELNGIWSLETKGRRFKRRLIAWQEKGVLKLADRVVANSPEMAQWVMANSRLASDRIAAIGNGVPIDDFRPMEAVEARIALGLEPSTRYLTYTSSLRPWHDTETLLRSMSVLLGEYPHSAKLLVVGDGPERQRMMELADQLQISPAVVWTGRVGAAKVPLYIGAADVCLAPFPPGRTYFRAIKVYEYMGCGRPIVTTRLNASYDDEIESCGCGVLVPPQDPEALAWAIIELFQEPELAQEMGRRGRQAAEQYYSWDRIAERTADFIFNGATARKNES